MKWTYLIFGLLILTFVSIGCGNKVVTTNNDSNREIVATDAETETVSVLSLEGDKTLSVQFSQTTLEDGGTLNSTDRINIQNGCWSKRPRINYCSIGTSFQFEISINTNHSWLINFDDKFYNENTFVTPQGYIDQYRTTINIIPSHFNNEGEYINNFCEVEYELIERTKCEE